MPTDKQISQLIINKLTQAQYDAAEAAGNINEDELYFITDPNEEVNITGAASTIVSDDLPANKVLISDSDGKVAASNVTSTELGHLSGVTSKIQDQLNNKVASADLVAITNDEIDEICGSTVIQETAEDGNEVAY